MKIGTVLLFFAIVVSATAGHITPLMDVSIGGVTRDDIRISLNSLKPKLTTQEADDLGNAVIYLGAECIKQIDLGMSENESNALFLSLTRNQTPRQIVLIAAGMMISQSGTILEDFTLRESGLGRSEAARRQDQLRLRSRGIDLVQRYGQHAKPN